MGVSASARSSGSAAPSSTICCTRWPASALGSHVTVQPESCRKLPATVCWSSMPVAASCPAVRASPPSKTSRRTAGVTVLSTTVLENGNAVTRWPRFTSPRGRAERMPPPFSSATTGVLASPAVSRSQVWAAWRSASVATSPKLVSTMRVGAAISVSESQPAHSVVGFENSTSPMRTLRSAVTASRSAATSVEADAIAAQAAASSSSSDALTVPSSSKASVSLPRFAPLQPV